MSTNYTTNSWLLAKGANDILVPFASTAKASEISDGICGRITESDCPNIKRYTKAKKANVHVAESPRAILKDGFTWTMIMKQVQFEGCFVRSAILESDILSIR